jgi:SAM-dependent methyltransferase
MSAEAAGAVRWHDIECGAYAADVALWRELADAANGTVLEIGAGTGRVALDLARRGHPILALDSDEELLAALRERVTAVCAPVETLRADARDFAIGAPVPLAIAPMQTVQLLGGAPGRAAFLACARRALRPGGLLVVALADPFEGFDPGAALLPLPDLREEDGWVYASQPTAVRDEGEATAIERRREVVGPAGERTETHDVVRLDRVTATELEAEAAAEGFEARPRRQVDATSDHVGSEVVVLRA